MIFLPTLTRHSLPSISWGVGPNEGFAIEDDVAVWSDFIEQDPRLNQIHTYVCLKTRVLFDPPTTSYLIGALDKQIQELEWRLNTQREETAWVDPDSNLPDLPEDRFGDPVIVDGGGA